MIDIRPARAADAEALAATLRSADRRELAALGMPLAVETIEQSITGATEAHLGLYRGQPAVVWGLTVPGLLSATAAPWMWTTTLVDEYPRVFLATVVAISPSPWFDRHPQVERLENMVHAENLSSIRWLKWLGFCVDGASPFGVHNAPFRRFWLERSR